MEAKKRQHDLWAEKIEKEIREGLKEECEKYPIKISRSINVLKDITVLFDKDESKFKMVFGDAEQDIVIYLDPNKYRVEVPRGGATKKAYRSFPVASMKGSRPDIIIPLTIFEIKYDPISHEITQSSSQAEQIKDKFPFVSYNLIVLVGKKSETLWRHGKHFDRIFHWRDVTKFDIRELLHVIKEDLNRLEKWAT